MGFGEKVAMGRGGVLAFSFFNDKTVVGYDTCMDYTGKLQCLTLAGHF